MWDTWGRQNIENYVIALAQYLRARLTSIWGPNCLGTTYNANVPHWARTGLTSFNPFSPGFDYNAPLTVAQATAQTAQSGNAVTALRNTHRVVVRNTNCPHSLRGNPGASADAVTPGAQTSSHPLRISTHLFHHAADVDQLVAALQATVPVPAAGVIRSR
jgi:selenocysteine lyase/cysteine desulfurase